MTTSVPFNINSYVRVKLTKLGLEILKGQHDKVYSYLGTLDKFPFFPPKTDEDGYVRMQLWMVMQTFGAHCGLAMNLPFETDIKFDVA